MKKAALLAVIVISILGFFSCNKGEAKGGPGGGEALATVYAVSSILAAQGPIQDYLALSGDIISSSIVSGPMFSSGRVAPQTGQAKPVRQMKMQFDPFTG